MVNAQPMSNSIVSLTHVLTISITGSKIPTHEYKIMNERGMRYKESIFLLSEILFNRIKLNNIRTAMKTIMKGERKIHKSFSISSPLHKF